MSGFPTTGQVLGRYRVERELGHGGMGVVYEATDTQLGRTVALKVLNPSHAATPEYRNRFAREAELLARLDSRRVVSIYDHGEEAGLLYLVTQFIRGSDLHEWIATHGPMPPALAVRLVAQVCEGLSDAHAVGVIHRDVKPSNVLLQDRGRGHEAYLCDFGIATTAEETGHTRDGLVVGSAGYIAPERHRGLPADARGDVYSMGCLLWHALTGLPPYQGTDVQVAVAHMQDPPPRLEGVDPFASAVNAVLDRAMAKDPSHRHPSASALLRDMAALAALAPGHSPRPADDAEDGRTNGLRADASTSGQSRAPGVTEARPRVAAAEVAPTASSPPPIERLAGRRRTRAAAAAVAVVLVLGAVTYVGASMVTGDESSTMSTSSTGHAPASIKSSPRRAASKPRGDWRCWNGRIAPRLSDCPTPSGREGLAWVFPSLKRDESSMSGAEHVRLFTEVTPLPPGRWPPALRQEYVVGGRRFFIRYNHWKTREIAMTKHDENYSNPRQSWTERGVDYGLLWRFTKGQNIYKPHTPAYTMDGLYADNSFGWTIGSRSQAGLDLALRYLEARPPSEFKGVRLR